MSDPWQQAVEDGADVLGDMLVELAEGNAEHTPDDMAAAVLAIGVERLVAGPPRRNRVIAAANALITALHGDAGADAETVDAAQRRFFENAAVAALAAADPLLVPARPRRRG